MTIEEAIKRSGTNNILAKGSTKKAQSIISENEEVLYAINTNVSIIDNKKTVINNTKGMFSLKNSIYVFIVVTNKRIIFCSSVLGNTKIKQILIQDINSIDENINGLTKIGQLRIQGITESFVINIYKSGIINELRTNIYKAQKVQKKINNISNNSNISNADEILKFKNLLDKGIITEQEFQKKKQELL